MIEMYMGGSILGVVHKYMVSAPFRLFLMVSKVLMCRRVSDKEERRYSLARATTVYISVLHFNINYTTIIYEQHCCALMTVTFREV